MKDILEALGVIASVIVLAAIIPMIGNTIGGEGDGYAAGSLAFTGGDMSDGDTVTIGGTVFEFDVAGDGVAGGNIDVNTDASPATASTNLATAINDDVTTSAIVTAVRTP